MKPAKTKRWLCIAFALILVGSVAAAVLQTSSGKVQVKDINLMTENHQYILSLIHILHNVSPAST